jgi:hypothetical protein
VNVDEPLLYRLSAAVRSQGSSSGFETNTELVKGRLTHELIAPSPK